MSASRFEVLRQIGTGGMGTVWLARDNQTRATLALKLLHGHLADDPEYVRRLQNEVQLAQAIQSPRVVQMYGFGSREGVPFIAMEYVPGQSLRENIHKYGRFDWHESRRLIRQAAEGLAAAHEAGIVHRDIKPSNIMVTPQGDVKLADFGVSRALDGTRLTRSSTMMGTPAYMAPESQKDQRSDLYALGCVLFEMLTGQQPVSGATPQDVMMGHLQREPNLALIPDGQARRITGWLLQKDPRKRPQSAAALIGALDGSTRIPANTLRTVSRQRRSPLLILGVPVVGGLVLLGGMAIGIASSQQGGSDNGASGGTSDQTAIPTATRNAGAPGSATPTPLVTASATSTATPTASVAASSTAIRTGTTSPTSAPRTATTPPIATATHPAVSVPTATATVTATATSTPTPTPQATPTTAPTQTPAPTATPTVAPSYFLDLSFDKYQYMSGETANICYDLTPNALFQFTMWKSVNGGPATVVLSFNDDGYGGCFQGVMGEDGAREYTFEARINGVLVAYRLAHAQVGPGNTTIMSVD